MLILLIKKLGQVALYPVNILHLLRLEEKFHSRAKNSLVIAIYK